MLRLPDGMRERIKSIAEENNRSMNAEIVGALDEYLATLNEPKFKLRLPPGLSARIGYWARKNHRSIKDEIVVALDEKYPSLDKTAAMRFGRILLQCPRVVRSHYVEILNNFAEEKGGHAKDAVDQMAKLMDEIDPIDMEDQLEEFAFVLQVALERLGDEDGTFQTNPDLVKEYLSNDG